MRILPFAVIFALVLSAPAAAATRNVKVGDDYFKSRSSHTVIVSKGTTVKWNWKGSRQHNIVVQKAPKHAKHFQSALKSSGSFSRTPKRRGTYKIICSIHAPDMRMTLKVT